MARPLLYSLAIFVLCLAPLVFQSDPVGAIHAGADISPLASFFESPEIPRPRWLSRMWRKTTGPVRKVLSSLKKTLTRRSHSEDITELEALETVALRYFKCFSFGPPETKAQRAIDAVCEGLKEEPIRRNCSLFALLIAAQLSKVGSCLTGEASGSPHEKLGCLRKHRLFLVHALLHEASSAKFVPNYEAFQSWFSGTQFVGTHASAPVPIPGGDALNQALGKLNWSVMGTLDNQHILAAELLKQAVVARRSLWSRIRRRGPAEPVRRVPDAEELVNQGYELFVSIPPHADPLAVRLTTVMLHGDASCPSDETFRSSENVMLEGKIRSIKKSQLIEAAVLIAVENLFNASDCATGETSDTDFTCRLLYEYDRFMQAGGPGAAPEAPEQLEGFEDLPLASFLKTSLGKDLQQSVNDLMSPDAPETSQTPVGSTANDDLTELHDPMQKTSEPPTEEEPAQIASQNPTVPAGRSERIRAYADNAAAAAVATARLGMRKGTLGLRLVGIFLKSSFFTRHAVRLLLAFTGKRIVPQQGLALFRGNKQRGKFYLGIYVKTLVHLSTGSSKVGTISAAVSGAVADEETKVIEQEQQPPVMLLQGGISPTGTARALQALGIPAGPDVPIGLSVGLTVAADVLLAFLLISFSTIFPPAILATAILFSILIVVKSTVNVFHATFPESAMEKAERKSRGFAAAVKGLKKW